jgi:hypothetical protein
MTHATDSNPTESKQAKNHPRRRLDHLTDLSDGFDQWDMIPRRLSRAYIDGKFPESKFRLLLCMMSHSGGFHIKRAYLEKRFSPNTLSKYGKELVLEGYVRTESLPCSRGGKISLYHVQPLSLWRLYAQVDDPIVSEVRPIVDPIVEYPTAKKDHKDLNLKDSILKNENPQSETKTQKPCHSGGVDFTQASITPTIAVKKAAPPLGKGVALDLSQVVQFVKSMEFAYKVGKKGNYDWEVANKAAERFILESGSAACSILFDWAVAYPGFQKGCVKVNNNMFDRLWAIFEEDQHTWSIDV